MSRCVLFEPGLLVLDDALPPDVLAALRQELSRGEYRSVHAQGWDKAWCLSDGQPMRGQSVAYDPTGCVKGDLPRYPTYTSVDALIDKLRWATKAHPDFVGTEGREWKAIYLVPWIYPPGSSLSRHKDAAQYSGAFTWYAQAQWDTHWGGELVVEPPGEKVFPAPHTEIWARETDAGSGVGTFVSPRPNRLVLLGSQRPHRIARIDPNAGAHARSSIAGFFLRWS
jgi:hypothetical protein